MATNQAATAAPPPPPPPAANPSPFHRDRWDILWAVQRSQRYHSRRRAFLEQWNRITTFLSILGGASVLASLGAVLPKSAVWIGAFIALVFSALDLVLNTITRAREHDDLRRRFSALEQKIHRKPVAAAQDIADWRAARAKIETDEPPTYVALSLLCENEMIRAQRHLAGRALYPVAWYKVATAQVFHWADS